MEQMPELPADFKFDGVFYRYGDKKQKWAIGKEWSYKGNMYQFIKYGDFKEALVGIWKSFDQKTETKESRKKFHDQLSQVVTVEKYESEKKNEDCQKKWFPIFHESSEDSELHDYLRNKQIFKNYIARNSRGSLLIPAYNQEGFQGVQMIFPDNETGKFKKMFSSGIKKKGSFCPLPSKLEYTSSEYIYLTEGYATACSVYMATMIPTICAFDSGNLFSVIQTLRYINPSCKIIICADDDKSGVGMKSAIKCKNHYSNVVIRRPKFEFKDDSLTDFNDLQCAESIESVKSQLFISETDFVKIIPLGSYGDKTVKYFYFSSMTNRIHQLAAQEHNKNNLLQMAPKKYWGEKYGFSKDSEGNPTQTPLWGEISGPLFVEQSIIGFFNPKNVRGIGPWIDNGRYVYNLGDKLLVNGEECLKLDTKYLYQTGTAVEMSEPLTNEEGLRLINTFKLLNYKNPHDHVYLCGWIAMAPIFNFIDWRPHIWLTGQKGSGKTSIIRAVSKIIGTDSVYQSVTAAAIRQTLRHDAMPMVIDEAEPGNTTSKYRMEEVIEVIRQCSSRMATKTIRGSSSGDAVEYNVTSCFMLGSIQPYLPTEADISRFFQIEIMSNQGQNSDGWDKINSELTEFSMWSPRLLARMVSLAPTIKSNIEAIRAYMIDNKSVKEARQADQIATALACYYALYSDKKLDEFKDDEIITHLVTFIDLNTSNYVEENDNGNQEDDCLNTILNLIVDNSQLHSIGHFAMRAVNQTEGYKFAEDALAAFGIKIIDGNKIAIANRHSELQKKLNASPYSNYSKILARHKDFITSRQIRIGEMKKMYQCSVLSILSSQQT